MVGICVIYSKIHTFISFQNINVAAFMPLVSLRMMVIPKVNPDLMWGLCEALGNSDTISFTAYAYDFTCFVYTAGGSYEDAIIRRGQTTLSNIDNDSNGN